MTRDEFKQFYDKGICGIADILCQQNKEFSFCDNINGLFEEYLNQESLTKFVCEKSIEKDQLDKHKIAACITVSIMKTRLLYSNNLNNNKDDFSLKVSMRMNEQLAFYGGLLYIIASMKKDIDIRKTLKEFKFPNTNYSDKADYIDSIIRTLYFANLLSGFHIGLLANVFFLLEEYHKLKNSKL